MHRYITVTLMKIKIKNMLKAVRIWKNVLCTKEQTLESQTFLSVTVYTRRHSSDIFEEGNDSNNKDNCQSIIWYTVKIFQKCRQNKDSFQIKKEKTEIMHFQCTWFTSNIKIISLGQRNVMLERNLAYTLKKKRALKMVKIASPLCSSYPEIKFWRPYNLNPLKFAFPTLSPALLMHLKSYPPLYPSTHPVINRGMWLQSLSLIRG